ncbi:hypothetical protein [Draconibacterium halophilum]|uniref:Uncharacterized protein n=1 Tax=Draconibacterium halophilum TaxID=2706887 RepID=A0A6C0R9L9_9BACT|nr:hypothetical protein [Draconibacterium halophilum]QIA07144.1 hypothetical protein G0Q07_05105 [Draconibacterium halophilum]
MKPNIILTILFAIIFFNTKAQEISISKQNDDDPTDVCDNSILYYKTSISGWQDGYMEQISSMTAVRGDLEQAIKDLLEILPGFYRMTNNEALGVVLPKIKELIDRTV